MYEQDQYDRERLQQNAISRCVKEGEDGLLRYRRLQLEGGI